MDALYEEWHNIRPDSDPGQRTIENLVVALDQRAPDGWYFGVKNGSYGFWPLGDVYWENSSIYNHL